MHRMNTEQAGERNDMTDLKMVEQVKETVCAQLTGHVQELLL